MNIVCWRQTAEIVSKWCKKGSKLGVIGVIQTRSYDAQDGSKRYVTEIVADEIELLGSGNREEVPMPTEPPMPEKEEQKDFTQVEDDDLPF